MRWVEMIEEGGAEFIDALSVILVASGRNKAILERD
jgi:hypothetical protein